MAKPALQQPQGLYVLFFTEAWERFGYYGMRALLVLYLVEGLEASREDALKLYAIYSAFVYFTPVIGGAIADRWLGQRKAVMLGGLLMSIGHFAMAYPGTLNLALTLLILGNGFFKPNITVLLGSLYEHHDSRRDGGFTIFYLAINIGAFLAPIVCGIIGQVYGWSLGFIAAATGMTFGMVIFVLGQKRLALSHSGLVRGRLRSKDWLLVLGLTAILIVAAQLVLTHWKTLESFWHHLNNLQRAAIIIVFLFGPFFLPRPVDLKVNGHDKHKLGATDFKRILAILLLSCFVMIFWMGFEQGGGTMNLFALEHVNRTIFGWEVPAAFFQAFNPLFIFFLAPVFSIGFMTWEHKKGDIAAPTKMGFGLIMLGLGFIILAFADDQAETHGLVSPLWLIAVYFFHTIGELFLSPIGMSMVTRLAPVQLASFMMGIWFTAVAVANYLAGTLDMMLQNSGIHLYWFLVSTSIGAGLLLFLITPLIKRLMEEKSTQPV